MALRLSNISLVDFITYLRSVGCERVRTEGGHEVWTRKGLRRSIVLQTHISPVPERIIKQSLANLSVSRAEFEEKMKRI